MYRFLLKQRNHITTNGTSKVLKTSLLLSLFLTTVCPTYAQRWIGYSGEYMLFTEGNLGRDDVYQSYAWREVEIVERDGNIHTFRSFFRKGLINALTGEFTFFEMGDYTLYPQQAVLNIDGNIYSYNDIIYEALGVKYQFSSIKDISYTILDATLLSNGNVLMYVNIPITKVYGNIKLADRTIKIGGQRMVVEGATIPQAITEVQKYGIIFDSKNGYRWLKAFRMPEDIYISPSIHGCFFCTNGNPSIKGSTTDIFCYNNDGNYKWHYKSKENEVFHAINNIPSTVYLAGYTKNEGYIGQANYYFVELNATNGIKKNSQFFPIKGRLDHIAISTDGARIGNGKEELTVKIEQTELSQLSTQIKGVAKGEIIYQNHQQRLIEEFTGSYEFPGVELPLVIGYERSPNLGVSSKWANSHRFKDSVKRGFPHFYTYATTAAKIYLVSTKMGLWYEFSVKDGELYYNGAKLEKWKFEN